VHAVVDSMGALLVLAVTPANGSEWRQVRSLVKRVQQVRGEHIEILDADTAHTGEKTAAAAQEHGMRLVAVKRPETSKGVVLLPQRWVVERGSAWGSWGSRFRRFARDDERLATTLIGPHFAAFVCLLLPKLLRLIGGS
jgi:transposase